MAAIGDARGAGMFRGEFRLGTSFNRRLAKDAPDAFQRFAFEVLRPASPGLRRFPTAGRDGAIDLLEDGPPRVAYQAKHVGTDGIEAARASWQAVERDLLAHVPTRDQSQYRPWWDVERPIAKYVLCLSSKLANDGQRLTLLDLMRGTFQSLVKTDERLSHLDALEFDIMDWSDFESAMHERPSLLFRWFPDSRPTGLVPLEELTPTNELAARLEEAVSYYSRDTHAALDGVAAAGLQTETEILERLDGVTGVVVTGAGGAGKSRLVLELARLAEAEGWLVFCVVRTWRTEMVDAVAERVSHNDRVLFVADYVETQLEFHDVVARVAEVNDSHGFRFHYLANCRASYFPRIRSISNQVEVLLGNSAPEARYRQAVVDHILQAVGLVPEEPSSRNHASAPLIAAFASYLVLTGRSGELVELSSGFDLGAWLRRRFERTLPDTAPRTLMEVLVQLPMTESQRNQLAAEGMLDVLRVLEIDSWIHHHVAVAGAPEAIWRALHDVLVDEVTVSALANLGSLAKLIIENLLKRARDSGTLRSAALAFQRVQDRAELEYVNWADIVRTLYDDDPEAWITRGAFLLGGTLVDDETACAIVARYESLFLERVNQRSVRLALRAIARRAAERPEVAAQIGDALERLSQRVSSMTFDRVLLEHLLRLRKDDSSAVVMDALKHGGDRFDAGFVLTRWLRSGRGAAAVSSFVDRWLENFGNSRAAALLMGAWLLSNGDPSVIERHAVAWLDRFGTERTASFLLKGIVKRASELPDEMKAAVLRWCRHHPDNPDTLWRMSKLGWHILRPEFIDETLEVAEIVIGRHLASPLNSPIVVGQLTSQIGLLVSAVTVGENALRVDDLLLQYLRAPGSFAHDEPLRHAERWQFVTRVASLVLSERVDLEQDGEGLRRFFRWVAEWAPEHKSKSAKLAMQLSQLAPAGADIWSELDDSNIRPERLNVSSAQRA